MALDMDFIGFSFNGRHSSEFNVYLVSNGSRYQDVLVPSPTDYTEQVPGRAGELYFGSDIESRQFSISIAYDDLSERQVRQLRQWLTPKATGELIFDERPYKAYSAKISGSPTLDFICFDKTDGSRVYKGEGSIEFICYYPYARVSGERKELQYYMNNPNIININQWRDSANLRPSLDKNDQNMGYDHIITINGDRGFKCYNPGDLDTNFIITFPKVKEKNVNNLTLTFTAPNNQFFTWAIYGDESQSVSELEREIYNKNEGEIIINTKDRRITYKDINNKETPIYFTLRENDFFKIPAGAGTEEDWTITLGGDLIEELRNSGKLEGFIQKMTIEYDYLYY